MKWVRVSPMQDNMASTLIGKRVYTRYQFWMEMCSFIREKQYQWAARERGLSVIVLSLLTVEWHFLSICCVQAHCTCYLTCFFSDSVRCVCCLILQMRRPRLSYLIAKLWKPDSSSQIHIKLQSSLNLPTTTCLLPSILWSLNVLYFDGCYPLLTLLLCSVFSL